jgi:ATP-dependent DNA ligase
MPSATRELQRRLRAEQPLPRFAPCLPRPACKPAAGPGWIHEIKHDGFRIHNGEDVRREPIEDRKRRLAGLLRLPHEGIALNEAFTGDGTVIHKHACALGYEGIVSKRLGSPYRAGRSYRLAESVRHYCDHVHLAANMEKTRPI